MAIIIEKKPGFVKFKLVKQRYKLDDLWFMVGSRCNLACSHCYVGSNPLNDTLQQMSVEEVRPFLEEGKEYGVDHVYFTGGEPFINRDIIPMLKLSLEFADVTVLTNATSPMERFIAALKQIQGGSSRELLFRVSMDHFIEEKHDKIRGVGNFQKTKKCVGLLKKSGFDVILTATAVVYEEGLTPEEALKGFKSIFPFAVEVKLLPFNLEMGANLGRIRQPTKHVFISEACMEGKNLDMFQCHNGRTVQKINGKMVVYPCPIIYDDKKFELATNLRDSFNQVYVTHKACYDFCYKSGGKCTN